jgi:hypothetical protein
VTLREKQAELELKSVWQYAQGELDWELAMENQAELDPVCKLERENPVSTR